MSRRALIVVTVLLSLGGAAAEAQSLPLLARARQLACAPEAQEAREAVLALRSADTLALGFPDEQLSSQGQRTLHASVLDILLAALALGVRRHPELEPEVAALVSSWNACALIDEGEAYDVVRGEGSPRRRRLVLPLPLGGDGLRAWKLLPEPSGDGPQVAGQGPASLEQLCADGIEGTSLFDFVPGVPSGPMRVAPPAPEVAADCLVPPPLLPLPASPKPAPLPEPSAPPAPELAKEEPLTSNLLLPPPGTPVDAVPLVAAPGGHGWTTGVSYSQGLQGQGSLSAIGLFSPVRGLTLRVGAGFGLLREFRPSRQVQRLTLSWGVGYSGGKPGTWSLQLDNWGPLDPTAPRDFLRGVAFDIGYQARLPALLERVLSTSFKLTLPRAGSPSTSAVFVVRPAPGGFASVALRFSPLERTPLTWSYSAGYALTWSPRTFSLTYAHWGATPAFEFDPLKGGALTASVTWSL
ncbi:hypothetical protein [Hyalangium gracile]|uniref:hypothetical protein n=1 Tax=Hyalangium gracile TaxID=394092 RepID=UPI001CC9E5EC|nr:hypothetical protein [Hyalangium gracile]